MQGDKHKQGIVFGALSYLIWGMIPLYWKLLDDISASEILSHRIIWSFVFMLLLLILMNKWASFLEYMQEIWKNKKKFAALFLASVMVSINWGLFIWAVNEGRVLDTSLGYYINPLVSVLLGVTILKEKLSKAQTISVCLAAVGVAVLAFHLGSIPWISLGLAVSFGLYGLLKVLVGAEAAIGLALETFMMLPAAVAFFLISFVKGESSFFSADSGLLLAGGGIATAVPLLLFAVGAKYIPLSTLGFLQYICPTISLFIGIFVYGETFTYIHLTAYLFIWAGLLLYSAAQWKAKPKHQEHVKMI